MAPRRLPNHSQIGSKIAPRSLPKGVSERTSKKALKKHPKRAATGSPKAPKREQKSIKNCIKNRYVFTFDFSLIFVAKTPPKKTENQTKILKKASSKRGDEAQETSEANQLKMQIRLVFYESDRGSGLSGLILKVTILKPIFRKNVLESRLKLRSTL